MPQYVEAHDLEKIVDGLVGRIHELEVRESKPQVAVLAVHSATVAIATSTATALAFDGDLYDTHVMHDNATNNSRLTCKVTGRYHVTFNFYWENNGTAWRWAAIRRDGSVFVAYLPQQAATGIEHGVHLSADIPLTVGQYLEAVVAQGSGGNLNVVRDGNVSPNFGMHMI